MTQVVERNNNALRDMAGDSGAQNRPAWARDLAASARRRFVELGFPGRRDEEWRYTNVAPIVETPFKLSDTLPAISHAALKDYSLPELGAIELVFVNGRFVPHLSTLQELPAGTIIGSLADALAAEDDELQAHLGKYAAFDDQAFVALNTAALCDGAVIRLPKGGVVEAPIHLLFVAQAAESGEPVVSHPRNLIIAGENSQATIIESYIGLSEDVCFTNGVTEYVCAQNSVIDHYKVQRENPAAFHVSTMQIQLAGACTFTSHSVNFGGSLVRNDINAVLAGEGIECTLNGLYMARGHQLVDNHTSIDHAMPHCNSHELYKGIIDGNGRGVFNGKIYVRQDAQKTDAKQTNQTLLLSDDAQINTKPQLEIYADDVKCTHGATVGQLSDEAMFYLRSRGIDKSVARDLLIYAFAGDIVSRIKVEPIRAQLDHILLSERALEGIE